MRGQHKARVRGHAPCQGLRELVALGAEAPPGSVGAHLDGAVAGEVRLEHGPGRHPVHSGDDGRAFQVRLLQNGLQSITRAGLVWDQWAPLARALPSLPGRLGGEKTATQEAMAAQCRDPDGVLDIGCPARYRFAVLGLDTQALTRAFEPIVDRTPGHASRNLANKILEWEYGIEIARTRLLMRTEDQGYASSRNTVSSHEGTCPQGAGVSYGQAVLSASPASGGHRHV
jgi:hypothetical protein